MAQLPVQLLVQLQAHLLLRSMAQTRPTARQRAQPAQASHQLSLVQLGKHSRSLVQPVFRKPALALVSGHKPLQVPAVRQTQAWERALARKPVLVRVAAQQQARAQTEARRPALAAVEAHTLAAAEQLALPAEAAVAAESRVGAVFS